MPDLYASKPRRRFPMRPGPKRPGRGDNSGPGKHRPGGRGRGGGRNDGGPGFLVPPIDRRTFRREMRAATNLQYGPLENQLAREANAQRFRMNQEIPAFYKDYQADLAALRGEARDATNGLVDRLAAASQAAGQTDAANRNAMMDRLQRDAQMRGSVFDPSADIGQAAAEGARANTALTTMGTLGGQGVNQQTYFGRRQAASHMAEREAKDRELVRMREINEDRRRTAKEKGAFRTEFRRNAREDERKYDISNRTLLNDRQGDKINLAIAKQYANKHVTVDNRYHGLGKNKDKGGYNVREALGLARQKARQKKGWPKSQQQYVDYLISRGVDAAVAKKAARKAFGSGGKFGGGGGNKPPGPGSYGHT